MKRIDNVVDPFKKRWAIQERSNNEWERIWNHPDIQAFRSAHPELNAEVARRSWVSLRQYITENRHCSQCPGLDRCPNMLQGHRPQLHAGNGYIDLRMTPCHKRLAFEKEQSRKQLIKSHHVPSDILTITFESITPNTGRRKAIAAAIDFCDCFAAGGRPERGIYFYGPFGVGKSSIASAMTQYLVEYGIDSLMVYVPEFVREMKEAIRDGMVQKKLDALKKATVLILDDIGAENVTPWVRDELIGAILQYRMGEKLPTVMTSNFDLEDLEDHFAHSDKGGTERIKAMRLMERIRHYMEPYEVQGPNRRQT